MLLRPVLEAVPDGVVLGRAHFVGAQALEKLAEHGVGRFKKHLLERYGDVGRIAAMHRIKTAFDPADIMNAGAIVRPWRQKSAS